ncbi:MAG TPA: RNA polymerase sigma factor [Candidatus Sulfotelmatobacter sp.]|jgi:RNA polymerase sigma-70 factor (ECF subfamily)|nr:RNA polymerase sigma factor [Candidatus Sulfotelmatobacter sp.]
MSGSDNPLHLLDGVSWSAEDTTTMDEQQFQALYEATARPIHAYLLGITGRRDVADDVLQETYFRFFLRRPSEMPDNETRRYLFRIATNLLRDRWRNRGDAQWPKDYDQGLSSDVDTQLDVRRVIRALKPRDRELLWLAYVEQMSHAEIAASLGLSVLSIRPLLFKARRNAAKLLRAEKGKP